jgi:hypothetical protein
MNVAFQLFQLQQIDSEIDHSQQRIDEIDRLLATNSLISSAEKKVNLHDQLLTQRTTAFNLLNDELEKKKIKKTQSQSTLYGGKVQNPKELEDLQNEIASLERSINVLEESLMQALVDVDNAEIKFELSNDDLKKARSTFATESAMLAAEKEKLDQKIGGLQNKRQPQLQQVDGVYLAQYDSLRKRKNGIAIALLHDSSCGACGANLTPSQRQTARSSSTLFICPSCGRIIYGSS